MTQNLTLREELNVRNATINELQYQVEDLVNGMTLECPIMIGAFQQEMMNMTQPKLISMKNEKRLFEKDLRERDLPRSKSPG